MHIVYRVYEDGWADILDVGTMQIRKYTKAQLKEFGNTSIFGLTVYNNRVCDITAMKIISFPTDTEAYEYNEDAHGVVINMLDLWWVIYKNNEVIPVKYYVYNQVGPEITYIGKRNSYTPYIQAAKVFKSDEAYKKANALTNNSKTGKYWKVQRLEVKY